MKNKILVFDVESVGLHGPGFAVGFVLKDFQGNHIDEGIFAVRPETINAEDVDGLKWVLENVKLHPSNYNCSSLLEMRQCFWDIWLTHRNDTILAADVPWPVEADFLEACIYDDLPTRRWQGPYPLLDIASYRLSAGEDAMQLEARMKDEFPSHNPLMDSRQSARQLFRCIKLSGQGFDSLRNL